MNSRFGPDPHSPARPGSPESIAPVQTDDPDASADMDVAEEEAGDNETENADEEWEADPEETSPPDAPWQGDATTVLEPSHSAPSPAAEQPPLSSPDAPGFVAVPPEVTQPVDVPASSV